MDPISINVDDAGNLFVQGTLTFSCIDNKTVKAFSVQLQDATDKIILDLKKVNGIDSAGLALLIDWMKVAENKNINLQFENIPDQLLAIARLGGLEQALVASTPLSTISTRK